MTRKSRRIPSPRSALNSTPGTQAASRVMHVPTLLEDSFIAGQGSANQFKVLECGSHPSQVSEFLFWIKREYTPSELVERLIKVGNTIFAGEHHNRSRLEQIVQDLVSAGLKPASAIMEIPSDFQSIFDTYDRTTVGAPQISNGNVRLPHSLVAKLSAIGELANAHGFKVICGDLTDEQLDHFASPLIARNPALREHLDNLERFYGAGIYSDQREGKRNRDMRDLQAGVQVADMLHLCISNEGMLRTMLKRFLSKEREQNIARIISEIPGWADQNLLIHGGAYHVLPIIHYLFVGDESGLPQI